MIVFLGGAKRAGKTTVAQLLLQHDPQLAIVEPDSFFNCFAETMPLFERARLCVELSARCARYLHDAGFTVIIPYPLAFADYQRYLWLLPLPTSQRLCITLAPSKEKLLARVGLLHDDSDEARWQRHIIDLQYDTDWWGEPVLQPRYPSYLIDSSDQTPAETARIVRRVIAAHRSLLSETALRFQPRVR